MSLDPSTTTTPAAMVASTMESSFDPACADDVHDEAGLWQLFRVHRDEQARQKLLALHLPYIRTVASTYYARRIHDEIEYGDYYQLASLGLIESLDRFDPDVGVQFRTYAARRMHGSILDGIERLTEKQQQIAARQRAEAQRRAVVKEAIGVPPLRTRSPEQVLQYVAEAGLAFALSWILDGTGMMQGEDKAEAMPFYRSVELQQLRNRIVEIVQALPSQEKRVIQSHYFQDVAFEEIASTMRLSRGRISQIHRQALLHLKEGLRPCDVSW